MPMPRGFDLPNAYYDKGYRAKRATREILALLRGLGIVVLGVLCVFAFVTVGMALFFFLDLLGLALFVLFTIGIVWMMLYFGWL